MQMTASEIITRSDVMSKELGATFGRLQTELLTPLIVRAKKLNKPNERATKMTNIKELQGTDIIASMVQEKLKDFFDDEWKQNIVNIICTAIVWSLVEGEENTVKITVKLDDKKEFDGIGIESGGTGANCSTQDAWEAVRTLMMHKHVNTLASQNKPSLSDFLKTLFEVKQSDDKSEEETEPATEDDGTKPEKPSEQVAS